VQVLSGRALHHDPRLPSPLEIYALSPSLAALWLDPMKEQRPLIVRALANEVVERPPVWFMRQAGRYLPEYRALRSEHTFLTMCHNPELAAEVTLQPLRRYPFDAGIVFSDILLPLESMGAELEYIPGTGPVIRNPVRNAADVAALKDFDPVRDLPSPMETIRLCTEAASVPMLGFAGAPFTMACYLIEGQGSRNWPETKRMMFSQPKVFQALLDRIADAVGDHLQAQIDAGAVGVQLFDTWAGALSPDDFRRWALPASRRALARACGAARIFFTKDSAPFLPWLREVEADAYALDWRVDIGEARKILGDVPVQGNLDPQALHAPHDEIRRRVNQIIHRAGPKGHVFNLGHGITPDIDPAAVQAAVDAVHAHSWS
jgi:uroporphyrinogen decarboxylase